MPKHVVDSALFEAIVSSFRAGPNAPEQGQPAIIRNAKCALYRDQWIIDAPQFNKIKAAALLFDKIYISSYCAISKGCDSFHEIESGLRELFANNILIPTVIYYEEEIQYYLRNHMDLVFLGDTWKCDPLPSNLFAGKGNIHLQVEDGLGLRLLPWIGISEDVQSAEYLNAVQSVVAEESNRRLGRFRNYFPGLLDQWKRAVLSEASVDGVSQAKYYEAHFSDGFPESASPKRLFALFSPEVLETLYFINMAYIWSSYFDGCSLLVSPRELPLYIKKFYGPIDPLGNTGIDAVKTLMKTPKRKPISSLSISQILELRSAPGLEKNRADIFKFAQKMYKAKIKPSDHRFSCELQSLLLKLHRSGTTDNESDLMSILLNLFVTVYLPLQLPCIPDIGTVAGLAGSGATMLSYLRKSKKSGLHLWGIIDT